MIQKNNPFERTRRSEADEGLSLAPLIDVVFLLIIFFLVSTTFTTQPGLQVYLPQSGGNVDVPQERWVVTITENGNIYLEDEQLDPAELQSRLREKKQPVIVRADEQVPHGTLVSVLDRIRMSGIKQVNIATRPTGRTTEETQNDQ